MIWIPLADPYEEPIDCELCGPSYDELTVEFDGEWVGHLGLGCTGGSSFRGDRSGLIQWLKSECAAFVNEDELADAINKINAA